LTIGQIFRDSIYKMTQVMLNSRYMSSESTSKRINYPLVFSYRNCSMNVNMKKLLLLIIISKGLKQLSFLGLKSKNTLLVGKILNYLTSTLKLQQTDTSKLIQFWRSDTILKGDWSPEDFNSHVWLKLDQCHSFRE